MKDVFVLVLFLSASELHIIASCILVLCHAYYVLVLSLPRTLYDEFCP